MSELQGIQRDWEGQATLNNATTARLHTAHSTTSTIFVTKITLSITTHAVKFAQVQDDNGTPLVIAKHNDLAAAAGVPSAVTWDFGRRGMQMTTGKNLDAVSEASGVAGIVYAEGYEIVN